MKRLFPIALLLVGCQGHAPPPAPSSTPKPQTVTLVRPVRHTVDRVVELPADMRAGREAKIYAKISGNLKDLRVNIGDPVRAGQVLATIDSPELSSDAAAARAQVEKARTDAIVSQAQVLFQQRQKTSVSDEIGRARYQVQQAAAEVSQAKAKRNLNQISYQRLKSVYSVDEGLIAHQELDQAFARLQESRGRVLSTERAEQAARSVVQTLSSNRTAAAQQVVVAQAQQDSANSQIGVRQQEANKARNWVDYTVIRAPFSGVITHRFLFPGDLVQSSAQSAQGTTSPIVALADESFVTLSVRVPELDTPYVHGGSRLELMVEALPGVKLEAHVSRTAGALDTETDRAMPIEADLPNPGQRLRPGMFARVRLVLESHPGVLALPTPTILKEKGKTSVFLLTGDKVTKKPVRIGLTNNQWTELKGGLSASDRVVIPPKEGLSDGAPVVVRGERL